MAGPHVNRLVAISFGVVALSAAIAGFALDDWAVAFHKHTVGTDLKDGKHMSLGPIHSCEFGTVTEADTCCIVTEKWCEMIAAGSGSNSEDNEGEGCDQFDKLQVVRAFGISHVILAGISLLAILGNHNGAQGHKVAAIATSALAAVVGLIAFAVFIDLKKWAERSDKSTYVNFGAGFGLFTAAWIASVFTAAAAATIKPKSLAAELGSDVKAAL